MILTVFHICLAIAVCLDQIWPVTAVDFEVSNFLYVLTGKYTSTVSRRDGKFKLTDYEALVRPVEAGNIEHLGIPLYFEEIQNRKVIRRSLLAVTAEYTGLIVRTYNFTRKLFFGLAGPPATFFEELTLDDITGLEHCAIRLTSIDIQSTVFSGTYPLCHVNLWSPPIYKMTWNCSAIEWIVQDISRGNTRTDPKAARIYTYKNYEKYESPENYNRFQNDKNPCHQRGDFTNRW
ncbi:uncharacterized protein LOC131943665 [Physella acuta]|uniref:uncharacterized protein LOC131943665 n=1 Tax=Physella acuta TaxID=109671 RepID=UPI0027DB1B77|nr:uncharacterized protein LOC131943665 [Physella acuta]